MAELKNDTVANMLNMLHPEPKDDPKNLIRQVIQEIMLYGLSTTDFFSKAAFYGGTSIRIFHGLDRFSEDMDFCLLEPDRSFSFDEYWGAIDSTLRAYGFIFSETPAELNGNTETADIRANLRNLVESYFPYEVVKKIHRDQVLRVKININVSPSKGACFVREPRVLPVSYWVKLFDISSLFASKLSAIFTRYYQGHEKGRDFYDYLFYLKKGVVVNMEFLRNCLLSADKTKYTDYVREHPDFTRECLIEMLDMRFSEIRYDKAKEDVFSFIKEKGKTEIEQWDVEFFKKITRQYLMVSNLEK